MSQLDKLYLKLPIALQNLVCSAEGWRIQKNRFGNTFQIALREAEMRTHYTYEKVKDYQDKRLQAFIQHATATVPYYKQLFAKYGIDPRAIRTSEDLKHIPILTKADVQKNYSDLVSESVPTSERIIVHTSGTTGSGLHFATTRKATDELWAVWWRYRRWHGIELDTLCGYFGGRSIVPLDQMNPPFWRYNLPGHQILFSAYHLSPQNIPHYIRALRKYRPPWLHGYPSLLVLIASYLVESGEDLGYSLDHITIGAENLTPQQENLMQQAFKVKPVQHYGMAEAVANISECNHGYLHVDEDLSLVEFIRNPSGYGYKVIGTNFTNFATPLIRYDVQDIVELDRTITCDCGRAGRIVKRIDGREEDYIILKNGARLGRMDHVFKDLINIHEAQLYQSHQGQIQIRIVKGERYTDVDEALLIREMVQRIGHDNEISILYCEQLKRSQSGKLRFVISDTDIRE